MEPINDDAIYRNINIIGGKVIAIDRKWTELTEVEQEEVIEKRKQTELEFEQELKEMSEQEAA